MKKIPTITGSEGEDVFRTIEFADSNVEDQHIKKQSHRSLRELIKQLPDEQKEVLILRHYGDLSFKEIAEITNCSINTALGRMRYALINLKKLIEEKAQHLQG
jgi:RNA polymerase sigma-70 factor (ECF subfamily)